MATSVPVPDPNLPQGRPFTSFNFLVLIDLSKVTDAKNPACDASFAECDGLEMTLEPKTIREGGRNTGPVHLAGAVSYGQLSLKRGMTRGFDLWKWFDKVAGPAGGGFRTTASVIMRASDLSDEAVFKLRGCLPVKLKASALNAKDGLVAIEEMQIAYENLQWEKPQA
jgi:phage tail-like protein